MQQPNIKIAGNLRATQMTNNNPKVKHKVLFKQNLIVVNLKANNPKTKVKLIKNVKI